MYIDIFLLILFHWAMFSGWKNGLIKEVFSTLGILAGLILAGVVYYFFGDTLFAVEGSETNMLLSIGAFILLWIALPIVLGLAGSLLTSALKGLKLGIPNSILGALLSIVKFALIASCALNMMSYLNILDESKTADSKLYEPAVSILPFIDRETGITDNVKEKLESVSISDTIWVNMLKDE